MPTMPQSDNSGFDRVEESEKTMTYEEMASDAGYRGEEAAQVAAALEARDRAEAEREWAAEQEAQEEERMSDKLTHRFPGGIEGQQADGSFVLLNNEIAALEARLDQANRQRKVLAEFFRMCSAHLRSAGAKPLVEYVTRMIEDPLLLAAAQEAQPK